MDTDFFFSLPDYTRASAFSPAERTRLISYSRLPRGPGSFVSRYLENFETHVAELSYPTLISSSELLRESGETRACNPSLELEWDVIDPGGHSTSVSTFQLSFLSRETARTCREQPEEIAYGYGVLSMRVVR